MWVARNLHRAKNTASRGAYGRGNIFPAEMALKPENLYNK